MTARWIGNEFEIYSVGDVGFLIETHHHLKGWTHYALREHPAKTNQSLRPRLVGWCGTTNDVCCMACGMARVVRMAKNGRALVCTLSPEETRSALENLGYPDLISEIA